MGRRRPPGQCAPRGRPPYAPEAAHSDVWEADAQRDALWEELQETEEQRDRQLALGLAAAPDHDTIHHRLADLYRARLEEAARRAIPGRCVASGRA